MFKTKRKINALKNTKFEGVFTPNKRAKKSNKVGNPAINKITAEIPVQTNENFS
jgi:hypothetical protein